ATATALGDEVRRDGDGTGRRGEARRRRHWATRRDATALRGEVRRDGDGAGRRRAQVRRREKEEGRGGKGEAALA
ncbi:hypothetical protein U1Q18_014317, partial [Sarracenia purpurea var. burkii]